MILQGRILLETLPAVTTEHTPEALVSAAAMQDRLRKLLARDGLPPAIASQAQLLIGLLHERQGDTRAAISVVRRHSPRLFWPARSAGRDDISRRPGPARQPARSRRPVQAGAVAAGRRRRGL